MKQLNGSIIVVPAGRAPRNTGFNTTTTTSGFVQVGEVKTLPGTLVSTPTIATAPKSTKGNTYVKKFIRVDFSKRETILLRKYFNVFNDPQAVFTKYTSTCSAEDVFTPIDGVLLSIYKERYQLSNRKMQIILDALHVEGVYAAAHHNIAKEYFNTDLIAELEFMTHFTKELNAKRYSAKALTFELAPIILAYKALPVDSTDEQKTKLISKFFSGK